MITLHPEDKGKRKSEKLLPCVPECVAGRKTEERTKQEVDKKRRNKKLFGVAKKVVLQFSCYAR